MPDFSKLSAVANADLPPYRWTDKRMVSGAVMKAVLWVLWAFEGDTLFTAFIAERACTSEQSVYRALGALVQMGVLVVTSDRWRSKKAPQPRAYRISPDRLRELHGAVALKRGKGAA